MSHKRVEKYVVGQLPKGSLGYTPREYARISLTEDEINELYVVCDDRPKNFEDDMELPLGEIQYRSAQLLSDVATVTTFTDDLACEIPFTEDEYHALIKYINNHKRSDISISLWNKIKEPEK
ncbi:hypothetical protein [Rhodococcus qingshengii]|uniref:hypothetical protein n=1 Tax=Rhodococcus qingshengii TaxID=334542 RepID=UPI0035D723A2